jgi:hypothetical protein
MIADSHESGTMTHGSAMAACARSIPDAQTPWSKCNYISPTRRIRMAKKTRTTNRSATDGLNTSGLKGPRNIELNGKPSRPETTAKSWTFLTNHAHVLILLSRNPSLVLREVAAMVGITERAVQRIIADLEEESIIEREKVGRQNHYRVLGNKPLRHPIESHRTVADLLKAIN